MNPNHKQRLKVASYLIAEAGDILRTMPGLDDAYDHCLAAMQLIHERYQ